ncbi:MAG: hypothetical protein LCH81_01060 [Bacteroidetes bacterium]|nr:hypothetical protein [Bacteroidota bacterium]
MATVQRNEDSTISVTFSNGYRVKFKQPNDTVLGMCMAASRRDPNGGADVLIENCLIEGDKVKLKNSVGYLKQLAESSGKIFGEVACSLSWDDDKALVEFLDGKILILKPIDRDGYGQAQMKAKQNPLNYAKHILACCWVDGDQSVKKSPGHLLGFSDILETFLEYTDDALGN